MTIQNNIISLNGIYGIFSDAIVEPSISYNNLWSNFGLDYQGCYPGSGDISSDPLFLNLGSGNYHLSPGSPAIDAGDPASNYTLEPSPNGNRINMGAYGGTPEAAASSIGDLDGDGDVDGEDLLDYAFGGSFSDIQSFAGAYGH